MTNLEQRAHDLAVAYMQLVMPKPISAEVFAHTYKNIYEQILKELATR